MKFIVLLFLLSFSLYADIVITNFEGKVLVNDLEISQKTKLERGYKISVPQKQESFAVITFKGGNRLLILSGEVIIEDTQELNSKVSIKYGEVFFHVENPDRRLITHVMSLKTKNALFKIYGGDSYLNLKDTQLFYAVVKGKTEYEDAWGKLVATKSNAVSKLKENKAPQVRPILYKTWKKIKIGFERMGIKLNK